MNKQNSPIERFVLIALLMGAYFYFFPKLFPQTPPTPPRPALTLAQAFKGIDPLQGPALSEVQANAEKKKLKADIAKNPQDGLADWSRLRLALLQQYVLKDLDSKTYSSGFMGMGPTLKYFPAYDEITARAIGDPIDAQALYQAGDLLWRQSIQNGGAPAQEAAQSFEALALKGRGNPKFLEQQIFVPKQVDPAKVPLDAVPPEGFRLAKISELRGSIENPNPQGIADRVNIYYSTKPLFKLFDGVVNLFGAQPTYSYGLAVLFFAVLTRIAVQPLTKRQYDSMKGMAVIAPEMKKIQDKYKGKTEGDAQVKMMKEIRELQQRHGVNPMLGCGLAALQMPVFFFFVYPLIKEYEPKMELVQASFLWIQSLARPDIPLLVLYGISMFFSFRLSSTPPTDDMQRQQQLIMSFVFPFIFPIFIITYPSAFTMYWMTYNAVSTFFQWRMIKAADPKKNIIKSLMGADLKIVNSDADAVPPRPGSQAKPEVKTLDAGSNGHSNGHSNGKIKSAPNGIVLTPLESNGNPNPKKKKKR